LVLPLFLLHPLGMGWDNLLVWRQTRIGLIHGRYPWSLTFWSVASGRPSIGRPATGTGTVWRRVVGGYPGPRLCLLGTGFACSSSVRFARRLGFHRRLLGRFRWTPASGRGIAPVATVWRRRLPAIVDIVEQCLAAYTATPYACTHGSDRIAVPVSTVASRPWQRRITFCH